MMDFGFLLFYVELENISLVLELLIKVNLGLCSASTAFEQEGIFIASHQQWHGTSGFFSLAPMTASI